MVCFVLIMQTNFLLQDHSERLHLGNGLIAELDVMGALSLELAGSMTVSLWNKNAESLIKNRFRIVFFLFWIAA